jgi:L-threonylcarbamoyladenylate synthase
MARNLVEFNPLAEKIFKKYLPGPLTIVLPKKPGVSDLLTAGLPTLGIRIPDNTVCRELSRLTHLPFTTTSANLSGQKTPYQISDVIPGADLVIDAGQLPEVLPSTVIDLTKGKINILRRGPISFSEDDLVVEGE